MADGQDGLTPLDFKDPFAPAPAPQSAASPVLTRPTQPVKLDFADPFEQAASAAARANHSTLGDVGRSALGALETGTGEGLQGIGDVTGWTGAQNLGKRVQAAGARQAANVSPQFAETTSKPILSREGFNLTNIGSKAINTVAGMAPQLAATLAAGALTAEAGGVGAIPVGAALFGTQGEAAGRNAGEEQVAALTPEEISKVPAYQQALAAGASPDQARAQLSESAANRGAWTSGLFGAGLGVAGEIPGVGALGRTVASKLTRPIGETAANIVGKGIGEGVGFGGINAAGQVASNIANPVPTPALENVGEAAASGVLPGFVLGAGRAGITHLVRPSGPLGRAAQTAQETGAAEPYPGAAPGSLADAANVLHRNVPIDTTGGVTSSAEPPASPPTAEQTASGPALRVRVPPPLAPWVDAATGEATPPADNQVLVALHQLRDQTDALRAEGKNPMVSRPQLAAAWGIPTKRLSDLMTTANAERKRGVTTTDAQTRLEQNPGEVPQVDPAETARATTAAEDAYIARSRAEQDAQLDQTGQSLADIRARLAALQEARGSENATSNDVAKQEQEPAVTEAPPAAEATDGTPTEPAPAVSEPAPTTADASAPETPTPPATPDASPAAEPAAAARPVASEPARAPEPVATPEAGAPPARAEAPSVPADQAAREVPVSSSESSDRSVVKHETTPNVGENQPTGDEQTALAQADSGTAAPALQSETTGKQAAADRQAAPATAGAGVEAVVAPGDRVTVTQGVHAGKAASVVGRTRSGVRLKFEDGTQKTLSAKAMKRVEKSDVTTAPAAVAAERGPTPGEVIPPTERPAPAIKVSTRDLAPKAGQTVRSYAREIARTKFADKTFKSADGHDIIVPWQGIKHASSKDAKPGLAALLHLDQLIQSSRRTGTEADRKQRKDIVAVHQFETGATIDGKPHKVVLFVREHADGKRYYDHALIKGEPPGIPGAATLASQAAHQPAGGSTDKRTTPAKTRAGHNEAAGNPNEISTAEHAAGPITDAEYRAVVKANPPEEVSTGTDAGRSGPGRGTNREPKGPGTAQGLVNPETPPKGGVSASGKAEPAAPKKASAIEDFGQKLGGARKDQAPSLRTELGDSDIRAQPLSKIWPASEVDAISDPFAAAVAFAARAEIPAKPRIGHKLNRWVEKVQNVRELARMAVDGKLTPDALAGRVGLKDFAAKVGLLQKIDRAKWGRIGDVSEHPTAYAYGPTGEKIPKPQVMVSIDGRNERFEGPKSINEALGAIKQRLNIAAAAKPLQFEIRGSRTKNEYFINKKGDSEYRHLKEFTDLAAARAYLKANHADLVKAWDAVKDRDNVTKADMRNAVNRDRVGPDYRDGKDVTPEQFADTMGFRGVEFGNWVKQGGNAKERQGLLNQAYDALMDLANIIGVPPRAMSLDGSLGLGLGSRGHGWASAHFESDRLVINLTKTRGAGALAHEWFHALDNYFARSRGAPAPTRSQQGRREGAFVTYRPEPMLINPEVPAAGRMTRVELARRHALHPYAKLYDPADWKPDPNHPAGVRPVVEKAFAELVNALNVSPMHTRALTIDKGKESGYWSRIIERAARSFENYVIARMDSKGLSNDYLANVRQLEKFNRNPERYPYLRPEEVKPVAEAFDNLFATLETRQGENGNVALFSKSPKEPNDLVAAPDGSVNFGEITQAQGDRMRRQAGGIRLPLGEQHANGTGFGRVHIEANHGKQIRRAGFQSVEDFVHHIAQHVDQIWRAPVGQLVLLARGEPPGVMFLRMEPARDASGDYYRVNTAFPVRNADYGSRKGWEKLWDGSEPPSSATGTRTDFAAAPGDESSPGSPNAVRQSLRNSSTISRDQLGRLVASTKRGWGKNQPDVAVVDSAEGLPAEAKRDPEYQRAEGYYDGKKVWLVASNLAGPARARQVLAHEAVGHYGVDRIVQDAYGKDAWDKVTQSVTRLDREGLGGNAMQDVLAETHRRYPGADATTFAKEAIAVMAEHGIRNGIIDRVVAAVRQYLRKIMPNLDLSAAEVRQLLARSDRLLGDDAARAQREQVRMVAAHAFDKTPDTFYSALTEAVARGQGAPKRADATAWKQWLDGAQRRGDFKGAEREWMGLDQWLDAHKGPVTRAELNDFVRENQVRVREVVHGDEPPINAADIRENENGGFDLVDEGGALATAPERPTRFGGYTLPGGKNYRELLLTMPQRDALTSSERAELGHLTERKQTAELGRPGVKPLSAEETARMGALQDKAIAGNKTPFRSQHFEEPNILTHVRFNDRTGPHGEKILHVEEVQSDWHQAGRKHGYNDVRVPTRAKDVDGRWEVTDQNGDFITGVNRDVANTADAALAEAGRRLRENPMQVRRAQSVPDAPFKKTEQWSMLAMKRVLRYAADHGYDKVTWTTGEQQAARYDLSKHVSRASYMDGRLVVRDMAGGMLYNEKVPEQGVAGVIGKDAAARLLAAPERDLSSQAGRIGAKGREITGDGLKMGGEGMKAFYDHMLPNELNKYAKQWGAKVGTTRLNLTDVPLDQHRAMRIPPANAPELHSLDITPAMRESVQQGQPLFARPDPNAPTDPSREPHKTVQDIEAVLKHGDPAGVREQAKGWLRGKLEDFRPALLGALQTGHILELMEDVPALKGAGRHYNDLMHQMAADREHLMVGAPDAKDHPGDMLKKGAVTIADELRNFAYGKGLGALRGKVRPEAQKLFDLMHQATVQRLDPSKVYERLTIENAHGDAVPWTHEEVKARLKLLRELALQRGGDPWADREKLYDEAKYLRNIAKMERVRERNWPKLQADWMALPEEGKRLYQETRDWHSAYRDETEKALIKNIEALDVPETYRRGLVQRMRMQFEAARREGVYFPLNRDGDYWIAFQDRAGNEGFKMFESARDFARGEKRLRAAGYQIDAKGRRDNNMTARSAPSGTFVRAVIDTLQKAKVSETVQDEVYQTFLRSLPELSMRKHSIHRRNIAGFSEDGLRAFAKNGYHGAHQLARLRHAQDMEFALEGMKASVDNWRRGENATDAMAEPSGLSVAKADALVGEMQKRHDWIMRPSDQQLANMVNSLGFVWYLGASPASALTNLTQIVQTALPSLGAVHGWSKATKYLGAAWRDAARTVGNMDRTLTNPEERRAFLVMQQRGDFSKTQSHTLAGLAEGNALQSSPAWSRVMNAVSWLFHTSEVINREATGMAAYRLARDQGKGFNEAVEYAGKVNADTMFDYSSANRPRYMQGNVQRIALQFKNYSIGMSWLFYRNLYQAMKAADPETRRVARRTVTGVLGMTAILAGATGLPVYNTVRTAANAANALWGDDDEPWNFDDAFHRWLADNLGQDAARLIAEGPSNYLTGANIASRTSMSNLWIHNDDQRLEGADAYHALLEALAGPIGGITNNFYVGAEDIRRGRVERGVERMLPSAAKNSIKALRYAHEGVNSLRGDPIVPDISGWEQFIQAIGFQPANVANQYRINTSARNFTGELQDRRINLMNAYAMAIKAGDPDDRSTAMQKISAFNQAHPEIAISAGTLRRSLQQRARLSAQARNGIVLNRKLAAQALEFAGAGQ